MLRRKDRKLVVARDAVCATYEQKLQEQMEQKGDAPDQAMGQQM